VTDVGVGVLFFSDFVMWALADVGKQGAKIVLSIIRQRAQKRCTQWLLSLYLVGAACAQRKIGGKFWYGCRYTRNKTSPYFFTSPIFTGQLNCTLTNRLFFNLHP